jgi:hypothetical protein
LLQQVFGDLYRICGDVFRKPCHDLR